MEKKFMCGSSCVKYVLDNIRKKECNIEPNMMWTTDLAISLSYNLDNEIVVYCYHSRLYKDYRKASDYSFDGFNSINKYEQRKKIIEKQMTKKTLIKEIDSSKYIIMCVESCLLNNNPNMIGGHFIVIESREGNTVNIINPIKNKYERKKIDIRQLLNLSKNFGSWRILIK